MAKIDLYAPLFFALWLPEDECVDQTPWLRFEAGLYHGPGTSYGPTAETLHGFTFATKRYPRTPLQPATEMLNKMIQDSFVSVTTEDGTELTERKPMLTGPLFPEFKVWPNVP